MTLRAALKKLRSGMFWRILEGVISSLIATYIAYRLHMGG